VRAFWDTLFRRLARRCAIPPSEARKLTLRQALNLLAEDEGISPADPHAGNLPLDADDPFLSLIRPGHGG
jgi:hypothetical protein